MKKNVLVILVVLITVTACFTLSACNSKYSACFGNTYSVKTGDYAQDNLNQQNESIHVYKTTLGKPYIKITVSGVVRKAKLKSTSETTISIDGESVEAVSMLFVAKWKTIDFVSDPKDNSATEQLTYVPDGDYFYKAGQKLTRE